MTNKNIIDTWPNVPTLVEDLGLPVPRTTMIFRIHKWKRRDYIPAEYWKLILKASKKRGLGITVNDLLNAAAARLNRAA
jgi:hypothetical protein